MRTKFPLPVAAIILPETSILSPFLGILAVHDGAWRDAVAYRDRAGFFLKMRKQSIRLRKPGCVVYA